MFINSSSKNNNPAVKGFTLVEVIVALGIGILIMTTFMTVTSSGFKNIRTISQTKKLHANAVYIINTLTYEIKQAENLEVLADGSELTITRPDSTTKIIEIDNNMIRDGVKLNNDNVEISNLNFIRMPKSVKINFTIESVSGETSFPVETTIAWRNNL